MNLPIDPNALSTTDLLSRAEQAAMRDDTHDGDERWHYVRELHARAEPAVFDAAEAWCDSLDVRLRCLGADVLGQLGLSGERPFASKSEPLLNGLLTDYEEPVITAALVALGHLGIGNLTVIASLASRSAPELRHAVAFCLTGRTDDVAIDTLAELSRDNVPSIRSWATFALAISNTDTPAVRDTLLERAGDENRETRGEALRGLAARSDERANELIARELASDEVSSLAVEAAGLSGCADFVPDLERLVAADPADEAAQVALRLCRGEIDGETDD